MIACRDGFNSGNLVDCADLQSIAYIAHHSITGQPPAHLDKADGKGVMLLGHHHIHPAARLLS
jgi:hypothetical protein